MIDDQYEHDIKESMKKLFSLKREYGEDRFNITDNTAPKTMSFIKNNPEYVSFRGTFRVYDPKLISEVQTQMRNNHELLLVANPKTDEMTVYTVHLPEEEEGSSSSSGGGGCFIATAVFESPHAFEVEMLRDYRDRTLLNSAVGKQFVKFYYYFSPSIASMISNRRFLKVFLNKYFFKPLIKHLSKAEKGE